MERQSLTRIAKLIGKAVGVVVALAVVVMILPGKARSQLGLDPCCAIIQVGLSSISSLLSNAVAKPLGAIQQLEQQSASFEQQVVFPVSTNYAALYGQVMPATDAPQPVRFLDVKYGIVP